MRNGGPSEFKMTKQPGGKQSAKHSAQIDPRFQIDGNERFAGSTDENAHDDIDSTAASGDEGPRNEACADEESDDMDVANDANAKSTNLRTDNVSTDRTNARSDAKPTKTKDKKPKKLKPLTEEGLVEFRKKEENKGVCYLSRVPPYLRVTALRKALSGYGTDVLRIFLQPEDTAVRARRLKSGGNKKKCFSEGWVEFADKRRAKRIANTLNNTPMGGGHRSFFAHDLWNIKYLHKFKWNHLTEKVAHEARVRQDKMRSELSLAKKETAFYLQKVGQAKAIAAMEARRSKRKAGEGGGGGEGKGKGSGGGGGGGGGGDSSAGAAGARTPESEAVRRNSSVVSGDGSSSWPDTATAARGGKRPRADETARSDANSAGSVGDVHATGTDTAAMRQIRRSFKQRRVVQSTQGKEVGLSGTLLLPSGSGSL